MATHEFRAQPREEKLAYYATAEFSRELLGENLAILESVSERAFISGRTPVLDPSRNGKAYVLAEAEVGAYQQVADKLVQECGFTGRWANLPLMFGAVFRVVERHLDRLEGGMRLRRERLVRQNSDQFGDDQDTLRLASRYADIGVLWACDYGLGREMDVLGLRTRSRSCQVYLRDIIKRERPDKKLWLRAYVKEFVDRGLIAEWDSPIKLKDLKRNTKEREVTTFELKTVEEIFGVGNYSTNLMDFTQAAMKLGYVPEFTRAFLAILNYKVNYGNGVDENALSGIATYLETGRRPIETRVVQLYATYKYTNRQIAHEVGLARSYVNEIIHTVLREQGYGKEDRFKDLHQGSPTVAHALEAVSLQLNTLAEELALGFPNGGWEDLTFGEREVLSLTIEGVPLADISLGQNKKDPREPKYTDSKLNSALNKICQARGWGRPDRQLVPLRLYHRLSLWYGVDRDKQAPKDLTPLETEILNRYTSYQWTLKEIAGQVQSLFGLDQLTEERVAEIVNNLLGQQDYGATRYLFELHRGSPLKHHAAERLAAQLEALSQEMVQEGWQDESTSDADKLTADELRVLTYTLGGSSAEEIAKRFNADKGTNWQESGARTVVRILNRAITKIYMARGWGQPHSRLIKLDQYYRLSPVHLRRGR